MLKLLRILSVFFAAVLIFGCSAYFRSSGALAKTEADRLAVQAANELDVIAKDLEEFGTINVSAPAIPLATGDAFKFSLDLTARDIFERNPVQGASTIRQFEELAARLAIKIDKSKSIVPTEDTDASNDGDASNEGDASSDGDSSGDVTDDTVIAGDVGSTPSAATIAQLQDIRDREKRATPDSFTEAFGRPDASALDIPLRDLIKRSFDDHTTMKLLEWMSNPENIGTNQQLYSAVLMVNIRPGRMTYRGYIGEVDVRAEYGRRDEHGHFVRGAGLPKAFAVFPAIDTQVLDLQTSIRKQYAFALLMQAMSTKAQGEFFTDYLKRLEQDASTRTAVNTVVGYNAQGRHFGWRFKPAFHAQADPSNIETGPDNLLQAQSFPALVLFVAEKSELAEKVGGTKKKTGTTVSAETLIKQIGSLEETLSRRTTLDLTARRRIAAALNHARVRLDVLRDRAIQEDLREKIHKPVDNLITETNKALNKHGELVGHFNTFSRDYTKWKGAKEDPEHIKTLAGHRTAMGTFLGNHLKQTLALNKLEATSKLLRTKLKAFVRDPEEKTTKDMKEKLDALENKLKATNPGDTTLLDDEITRLADQIPLKRDEQATIEGKLKRVDEFVKDSRKVWEGNVDTIKSLAKYFQFKMPVDKTFPHQFEKIGGPYTHIILHNTTRWLRAPSPKADRLSVPFTNGHIPIPFSGELDRGLHPRLTELIVIDWAFRLQRARRLWQQARDAYWKESGYNEKDYARYGLYATHTLEKRFLSLESRSISADGYLELPEPAKPKAKAAFTIKSIAPKQGWFDRESWFVVEGAGFNHATKFIVGGLEVESLQVFSGGTAAVFKVKHFNDPVNTKVDVAAVDPDGSVTSLAGAVEFKLLTTVPDAHKPKAKIDVQWENAAGKPVIKSIIVDGNVNADDIIKAITESQKKTNNVNVDVDVDVESKDK